MEDYNEFWTDRLYDPYEPAPRDLEAAIGRFLGVMLGFGVSIIVCGLIYMFS